MVATISPREKALTILTYWWVVAAAAILGGLAGLGIFALKEPVYEAQVSITMGINFARTGYMEQYDKDLALGLAGSLIYSADVLQQVVDDAQAENIAVDFASLKHDSSLERKSYEWILRVRHTNPEQAVFLANHWIDLGVASLGTALQHAVSADGLQEYMNSLETCVEQVAVNAVVPACPYASLTELQTNLSRTENEFLLEKQAARNVFPYISYQVTQLATTPQAPVVYGRNNLVLAGLLIGLLAGTTVVSSGLPARWQKKD
ncbi:hypothetical protein EG834_14540 [bacterium]|nr:hypothetical protein [bacterium]